MACDVRGERTRQEEYTACRLVGGPLAAERYDCAQQLAARSAQGGSIEENDRRGWVGAEAHLSDCHAAATWSGSPCGTLTPPTSTAASALNALVMRVSIIPKATALARMPSGPHSLACVLVRPMTPAFAAA